MNKKSLVTILRQKYGFSISKSSKIIDTILSTICKALKNNQRAIIQGFGSFTKTKPKNRTYKDLHTKKLITRLGKPRVKFKASKAFLS